MKISLKQAYYRIFAGMIVLPLLIVLAVALLVLGKQYKEKAIENIEGVQQTVAAQLLSDVDFMSMRLSQLTNVNDNIIMQYAAETDTKDRDKRYEYQKKLDQAGNMMIEPVKDVVSIAFYMKSGKETFLKSNIKRSVSEVRGYQWYQDALANPNSVKIGSYQTTGASDLYQGGGKDQLVLIYALAPNVMIDRSQSVEMVVLYQTTDAGSTIRNLNRDYNRRENKFGIMQLVGENGQVIFRTDDTAWEEQTGYTCVSTPIALENTEWYLKSYIKTTELMLDFTRIAVMILLIAALIFAFAGYFAGYFIRKIVNPIEELSSGLKQIEDGNMEIHITPQGQTEIRDVIHHFNAMVRSLNAMVADYEGKMRRALKTPGDYLAALMEKKLLPEQVMEEAPDFFAERYAMIALHFSLPDGKKSDPETVRQVMEGFERNPRYTLHCVGYQTDGSSAVVLYRITEENWRDRLISMVKELQSHAKSNTDVGISCCIGTETAGAEAFFEAVREVQDYLQLRYLYGEYAIIDLNVRKEEKQALTERAKEYQKLAEALYGADDKNFSTEKELLYDKFNTVNWQEAQEILYAVILAIATRFAADGISLFDIFHQEYNYEEKTARLEDVRSMKMWITNYVNWVMDYSAGKVDAMETNVIVKAKRYMADHYDDAELTLSKVAEQVGLSEKYFTNRFTKETGETFSTYLTQLRIQKAKELLRTTNFKIYEIGEMAGYRNAEHFARMFKKETGCTPAQFRKQENLT